VIAFLGVVTQLAIVANGPVVTNACQPFDLTVAVRAPGAIVPQITAPSLAPFDILSSSPSPHVTVEPGGQGSVLAEFRYVLTTEQTGTFTVPPFEARLEQTVVRSRPLSITVRGPRADNVPSIVTRARIDTGLEVNFQAIASPETVFVGQQVNYEVAVFLNENVRDRLRRNPTFYPPDIQSMLAYDLPVSGAPPRRRVGSRCFDALVYQRALFPLIAGKFVIPPSQLVYALSTSAGFFSREESHELQTENVHVIAVEPPAESRPDDWSGAVGNLHLRARVDTNVVRVGDPLLLTVQVAGAGNVKLFPRPDVQVPWASVVRGDERVHVDSSSSRINGSKEFDWVLTPRIAGELDIPPIRYSYFNPDQRRYAAAEAVATRVRVVTGALATSDTARIDDVLSIRPRYQGPVRTPLHQQFGFWLLVATAPIPALGFRSRERRRRVISTESPADRLHRIAMSSAVERPTPPVVRRAFGDALGARLGLAPTVFTRPGALARALRRSGVSRDVAERCEGLMRELDGAAYSREGALAADAAQRAIALYRTADNEALPHEEIRLPLSALGVLLVFGLSAGVLAATPALRNASDRLPRAEQGDATILTTFDSAVSAYGRRDYASSRDAFRSVSRVEPRAADAWANYGTAAWAAGDTARAVAGWQRALRLEPLASDARDRVQLAHGVPIGSAGFVPPTPLSLVASLGLLLWLSGWTFAARRAARGQTLSGPASSLLIAGAITLIATFGLESQLAGRRVAVVRATTQLHGEPMLQSERSASALIGEVVRIKGVRGAWTLVGLDDGRDGWIDSSTLISLDQQDSSGD
jgi:tetratricopeptide (TPR) repeat protein